MIAGIYSVSLPRQYIVIMIAGLFGWIGVIQYSKYFIGVPGQTPRDIYPAFWVAFVAVIFEFVAGGLYAFRRSKARVTPHNEGGLSGHNSPNGDAYNDITKQRETFEYGHFDKHKF